MTYRYLNLSTASLDRKGVGVRRWYDRSLKVWTGYLINKAGDQISDAVHAHSKADVSITPSDYTAWED